MTESGPAEPSRQSEQTSGKDLRSVAVNVGSLLTTNVINRGTSFVVYAMVAGFLGATELGRLALAVSLFQLVSRFALLGLENLMTREIARERAQTGRFLATGSAAVVGSSLASLPLIWGFVELMGYSTETARVVLLLFLGLIPFGLGTLTEATFLGWERSQYVAYTNSPIWIAQTVVAFLLLNAGHGVDAVALSMVAAYAAIAIVHWIVVLNVETSSRIRIDRPFLAPMLRSAAPFLGIGGLNALRRSLNVVLLSGFASEAAVGVFAAARQLLVPLNLIFQATGRGVFPAMVRHYESGTSRLRRLGGQMTEFTLALAIPAATGLFVLAGPILLLIYRDDEFLESVVVLRILVWTTLYSALTWILGQILWASGRERVSLRISLVNTAVMLVASWVLIWQFDIVGAAIASLIVGTLNVAQHYVPVAKLLGGFDIVRFAWNPLVASAIMAAVLVALTDAPLWLRIAAGGGTYLVALALLYLSRAGRYAALRSQFPSARAER